MIDLLRQKVDFLLRRKYGVSSEKVSAEQVELGMALGEKPKEESPQASEEQVAPEKKKRRKARTAPKKPRIPENLPVESREVIVPQEVLDSPDKWRVIGEEISEYLDFEPGHFFKRLIVRPKYVRLEDRSLPPIIAPLPKSWTERCIAAPGLQAYITISKYCDHLPLYRQEEIFRTRYDVLIPRNTMARWVEYVSEQLKLIYLFMAEEMFSKNYLQVDETPIKYLEAGSGKAQQGYLWVYSIPQGDVIFDWQTGRGHDCLLNMLTKPSENTQSNELITIFQGVLQCDGYGAYKTLVGKVNGIQLAGCWAHVRRKFFEALEHEPLLAGWIMVQIQNLYFIERQLRETRAGPRLRESVRASQSLPILKRIKKALLIYKARLAILPQSLLGKAVSYALAEWNYLEVYIKEGRIEIDNNLVENAIRPTAVGKKNWLFIGNKDTGERTAIIYSILESCRRRAIDPHAYLRDVLTKIPDAKTSDLKDLTPAGWAAKEQGSVAAQKALPQAATTV